MSKPNQDTANSDRIIEILTMTGGFWSYEQRKAIEALITQAVIKELSKVDPIASHELAATVEERIAELKREQEK